MTNDDVRPWIGPMSSLPAGVRRHLETVPSFRALVERGWVPERTLAYAPRRREGYDLDVFVLGRSFARDSRSPIVWFFSTIGLCTVEQGVGGGRRAFRHFELALGTNNAERDDPFPSRLGVV